jgi:GNAT superfamily N-acetyltransferase
MPQRRDHLGMQIRFRHRRLHQLDPSVASALINRKRRVPLENAPSDADRGYITLFAVSPRARRAGIGGKLLDGAEMYLRSQGRTVCMMSSYAPGYFIPGLDVAEHAEALEFLKKRGYGEVYRPVAMRTDLSLLAMPAWVEEKRKLLERQGVMIEPYTAAMTTPLLEFALREFPGDWVRVVKEAMGAILLGASPARLFVARDKGEVVGFSHFSRDRFGPIGVSASQRGRGVGQLLMFATLGAQKQEGHSSAYFLWSDDKTAERLYNAAGFKEFRRFALLKKTL